MTSSERRAAKRPPFAPLLSLVPCRAKIRCVGVSSAVAGLLAVTAMFASAAASTTPFPSERQGNGTEPISGGAVFAGHAYRTRSAIVHWDRNLGSLDLYLFRKALGPVRCDAIATIAARQPELVQVGLERGKPVRLAVGRPLSGVVVQFIAQPGRGEPAVLQVLRKHVQLVLTRVDTSRNGVWHGRLNARRALLGHKAYSYNGTFAAKWCVS